MCLARLLNRSGFRFVTFFAVLVHSRFASFRLASVGCLHTSQPLNHSPHKIIHLSASLLDFINLSFSIPRAKNRLRYPSRLAFTQLAEVPNLRAFSRGRSHASSSFVIALHSPLRSTRGRLAPTGNISLR